MLKRLNESTFQGKGIISLSTCMEKGEKRRFLVQFFLSDSCCQILLTECLSWCITSLGDFMLEREVIIIGAVFIDFKFDFFPNIGIIR